jgi:amidohydrolase
MGISSSAIAALAAEAASSVVALRRRLHRTPEPGFQERRTAEILASELRALGLDPRCGIAETGITARLSFPLPGPTVMIRADMDALPLREATGLSFASAREGYMHACGHDGHMAMALGAARVLAALGAMPEAGSLRGGVLFLFQPAEESLGGAAPMIASGALEGVDFCLAAHIWPDIPEGTVGVRQGPLMAAMDKFEIILRGRGGHTSQPHLCADVVGTAARIVCALQQIVSRRVDPFLPATLSVGCLQAGEAYNVLPQIARILGSARTFHPGVREAWQGWIRQVAEGVSRSAGTDCELSFFRGDGPVVNDPRVARAVRAAAVAAVGAQRVLEPPLSLGGEDFSRYQEVAPGCLFFLGSGTEGGKPLHHPEFTFAEDILTAGVEVFCRAALNLLAEDGPFRESGEGGGGP